MSVAGVRTSEGEAVWVRCDADEAMPGDRVRVRVRDHVIDGYVFAAPVQLTGATMAVSGEMVEVRATAADLNLCVDLPGADMPALGSEHMFESRPATVIAIDAVERRMTIRFADGGTAVEPIS